MNTQKAIDKINDAIDAWTGWDWAHSFTCGCDQQECQVIDGPGDRLKDWDAWVSETEKMIIAEGRHTESCASDLAQATRYYGEGVECAAETAACAGRAAIMCLQMDHLGLALENVREAAGYENEYGDTPVWGSVEDMIGDLYQAECEADQAAITKS